MGVNKIKAIVATTRTGWYGSCIMFEHTVACAIRGFHIYRRTCMVILITYACKHQKKITLIFLKLSTESSVWADEALSLQQNLPVCYYPEKKLKLMLDSTVSYRKDGAV